MLVQAVAIPVNVSGAERNNSNVIFTAAIFIFCKMMCKIDFLIYQIKISAAFLIAPDADWDSSCGKLFTEEILAGRTRPYKKKNLNRVPTGRILNWLIST